MRLVWHIAVKDARVIAVPLACWLMSFPAVALWLWLAPTTTNIWPWDDLSMWLGGMGVLTGAIAWVQVVMGGVLAGCVFQDDPIDSTTAFWRTRPVSAWRLIAGKLTAVTTCMVVAPVVVLLPVWAGSGFSAYQMLEAAWDGVKWQGLAAWLAVVVGSVTRNLVQFLFAAIATGLIAGVAIGGNEMWERTAVAVCFVLGSVVLGNACLQKPVRTGWAVLGLGLMLLLAGRFGFSGGGRVALEEEGEVEFVALPDVRARLGAAGMRALEERAARVFVGSSNAAGDGRGPGRIAPRVVVTPRIVGACPLREGAGFQNGAARLHILATIEYGERGRSREFALRLEERDAWRSWREGSFSNQVRSISGDDDFITRLAAAKGNSAVGRSYEDVYLVLVPSLGAAAVMNESVRVTIARYSLMRSVAAPTCALPLRDAQGREVHSLVNQNDREAVLVKVRLEKTPRFTP